jgi:hypothetical protein
MNDELALARVVVFIVTLRVRAFRAFSNTFMSLQVIRRQ